MILLYLCMNYEQKKNISKYGCIVFNPKYNHTWLFSLEKDQNEFMKQIMMVGKSRKLTLHIPNCRYIINTKQGKKIGEEFKYH